MIKSIENLLFDHLSKKKAFYGSFFVIYFGVQAQAMKHLFFYLKSLGSIVEIS